jgi:multicomponent Na+:H+ antiporter subunit D
VFYELLTLITYPLVTHHGTDKARNGGRTYLGLLIGTSVLFLLPALVFTWHVAGTTDFAPGGILPAARRPRRWPACWRCTCSASARRR